MQPELTHQSVVASDEVRLAQSVTIPQDKSACKLLQVPDELSS